MKSNTSFDTTPRLIEELHDLPAQVAPPPESSDVSPYTERPISALGVACRCRRNATSDAEARRRWSGTVGRGCPTRDGLAGDIVQRPALAGFHAGLVDPVAEHVVVVVHDDPAVGVDHLALVAFDVESGAGGVELLAGGSPPAYSIPVVSDRQEQAPERIHVRTPGVPACTTDLLAAARSCGTERRRPARRASHVGRYMAVWQPLEEAADVRVGRRVRDQAPCR